MALYEGRTACDGETGGEAAVVSGFVHRARLANPQAPQQAIRKIRIRRRGTTQKVLGQRGERKRYRALGRQP